MGDTAEAWTFERWRVECIARGAIPGNKSGKWLAKLGRTELDYDSTNGTLVFTTRSNTIVPVRGRCDGTPETALKVLRAAHELSLAMMGEE